MCVSICLNVCLCTRCLPSAHRGRKRATESLNLELQMIVSIHVDVGS